MGWAVREIKRRRATVTAVRLLDFGNYFFARVRVFS